MARKQHELLTEVELEFMTALWALEKGSVRDILAQLPENRNLAYTSGATIMRILEQKKFVTSEKVNKKLVYQPILAKDAYQIISIKNLSTKLFNNAPEALVAQLIHDEEITNETLGQLRALIDRRLNNEGG